jgi:hypothetical protein
MSMLFFAGPAHVGQSFTYRVTSSVSTQATPKVSTLILNWTAPTRIYARLSGDGPATAVSITRSDDGTLSVGTAANANDEAVVTLLNQLNFPGGLAASLNGSDHAQTTVTIVAPTPSPAPASSSTPARTPAPSPAPVQVPVALDLVSSDASTTLIAEGNTANHSSSSGWGRHGGGGGWGGDGWNSRGSDRNHGKSGGTPPVDVALEAIFDQSGSLVHASFRETFGSTSKGAQPLEDTITIDRIDR